MDDDSKSPDPSALEPSEEKPGPLISTLALRVFSFFLTALLGISFGASGLVSLAQWLDVGTVDPEALNRVFGSGEDIDPVLGLWLRAGTAPLILWIAWFFIVRFDGQTLSMAGLKRPRNLGVEALLGCLAAALTLMVWFLGIVPMVNSLIVEWAPEDFIGSTYMPLGVWDLSRMILLFLLIAFQNELVFRGYIYSTFRERLSWVHAAGFTNLLEVGLYAGHPSIGSAGLLNVFLLGLALAAMREKTDSLWMSTLFSGIWNVVLGCVLSLPISGVLYPRLFNHQLEGPEGLTGGVYGPESSWVLAGLLTVLVGILAMWTDRRAINGLLRSGVSDHGIKDSKSSNDD